MFRSDRYAALSYRTDIQGLRAIGALTIMVFHIWMNKVSGGVDIFIVVSGYLLTAVYIKNIARYGYTGPALFLLNIFKRIYPSAFLVIACTALGVLLIVPGSEQNTLLKEGMASLLHLENIQLIRKATDYLGNQDSSSPFQQFWALSVQVQIYLILAIALFPVFYWAIKRHDLKPIVVLYSLVLLLSFAYANYAVQVDPSKAYFNTLARLWEFCAGGLVYLYLPSITSSKKSSDILGVLGIALIFVAALLIPKHALYPGYPALVPVLAAVLVLIAGHAGTSLSARLLSFKPLVLMGGFSFTIYLWHWPLLVFYKSYFMLDRVSLVAGLAIIALSIVCAYIAYAVWERGFQRIGKTRIVVNSGLVLGCLLLGGGLLFSVLKVSESRLHQDIQQVLQTYQNKTYNAALFMVQTHAQQMPYRELKVARSIVPAVYSKGQCHQNMLRADATSCTRTPGREDALKLLVVGSSHIVQWLPALEQIARERGFRLDVMTKSGCPLGVTDELSDSCKAWNKNVLAKAVALDPDIIITNSTRTYVDRAESVPAGLLATLEAFKAEKIPVIGIRDNPRFSFEATQCAMKNYRDNAYHDACSMPRDGIYPLQDPAAQYSDLIDSIDMSKAYCSTQRCYTAFNDVLIYRDKDHIGVPYVYSLQDKLEGKLLALLDEQ